MRFSVLAPMLLAVVATRFPAEFSDAASPETAPPDSGKTERVTVITADRLTYDYRKAVAVFDGRVTVNDAQMRIDADRIIVTFSGTNELKTAEAVGRVRLTQGEKTGRCSRMVYSAETGQVVMSGSAVLQQPTDSVAADEITFLVQNDEIQSVRAVGNVHFSHTGAGKGTPDFPVLERKKKTPR